MGVKTAAVLPPQAMKTQPKTPATSTRMAKKRYALTAAAVPVTAKQHTPSAAAATRQKAAKRQAPAAIVLAMAKMRKAGPRRTARESQAQEDMA